MSFTHSIKVPTQYKRASFIFKKAIEEGKSVKTLVFEEKHAKIPNLLALFGKYTENKGTIESAIDESGILTENPRMNPYMCRVLVTEMLFGTKNLKGQSKPVLCVQSYKDKLIAKQKNDKSAGTSEETVGKPRYIRVNTNLTTVDEILETLKNEEWQQVESNFDSYDSYIKALKSLQEPEFMADMHVPNLFSFVSKWKNYWACHDLTAEKKILLQDKATCMAAELLQPNANSIVLDMCAAPGMKTIQLSNIMKNHGKIYAVEFNKNRYDILCNMVSSSYATSVTTVNSDALEINDENTPGVEYILVDPPCSGSGMSNRLSLNKDKTEEKDSKRLWKLGGLQIKLLQHAMTSFPNAKRIVYSTCSVYEEENEQVISKCLERCENFKLMSVKKLLNNNWNNVGSKIYKNIGKKCFYALPNDDCTDGIFIAVFERNSD